MGTNFYLMSKSKKLIREILQLKKLWSYRCRI